MTTTAKNAGWVGFDLDGVLCEYHGAQNTFVLGPPIAANVKRCKEVIALGYEVRVLTARVDGGLVYPALDRSIDSATIEIYRNVKMIEGMIQDWTQKHIGVRLAVTCQKDAGMLALYDDRCIQVEKNTGKLLGEDFFLGYPMKKMSPLHVGAPIEQGYREEIRLQQMTIDHLRRELVARRACENGSTWFWQNDSHDHLDSLASECIVAIRAGDLRELLLKEGSDPR